MPASLAVDRLVLLASLLGFACGAPGSQAQGDASGTDGSESGTGEDGPSGGVDGDGSTSLGSATAGENEGTDAEAGSGTQAGDDAATGGSDDEGTGSGSDDDGSGSTGGEPTLCDRMADKYIECNPQYSGARALVLAECESRRQDAADVSEECAAAADELIDCASMLECPDLPDTVGCEPERAAVDAACEEQAATDGGSSTGA